jgi:hypothetical protein
VPDETEALRAEVAELRAEVERLRAAQANHICVPAPTGWPTSVCAGGAAAQAHLYMLNTAANTPTTWMFPPAGAAPAPQIVAYSYTTGGDCA